MEQWMEIAGCPVRAACIDENYFKERFREYRIETPEPGSRKAVFSFSASKEEKIPFPKGRLLYKKNGFFCVLGEDGSFFRCYSDEKRDGELYALIVDNKNHREIRMYLTEKCEENEKITLTQFEYLFQSSAFARTYTSVGNLVLHGSGISYGTDGILFSADSGVGKSTHTAHWKRWAPEKVEILNDDKPAISFDGEAIFMHGTPWSGKSAENTNRSAKLKAVVMIRRGNINQMERLSGTQAFCELAAQICCPRYHTELMKGALLRLGELVETIPVYRLSCTIGEKAVETAWRGIYG